MEQEKQEEHLHYLLLTHIQPGIQNNAHMCMGVSYSLDRRLKDDLNYKEILSQIKLLAWCKQRDLTIMGKIHLLKTYALSKLN